MSFNQITSDGFEEDITDKKNEKVIKSKVRNEKSIKETKTEKTEKTEKSEKSEKTEKTEKTDKISKAKKQKKPIENSDNEMDDNIDNISSDDIKQKYQKKTQLEHIKDLPDTYIGSIVKENSNRSIAEDDITNDSSDFSDSSNIENSNNKLRLKIINKNIDPLIRNRKNIVFHIDNILQNPEYNELLLSCPFIFLDIDDEIGYLVAL